MTEYMEFHILQIAPCPDDDLDCDNSDPSRLKQIDLTECSAEKREELGSLLIRKYGKKKGEVFFKNIKCIETEELYIQGEPFTRSFGGIEAELVVNEDKEPKPCNIDYELPSWEPRPQSLSGEEAILCNE